MRGDVTSMLVTIILLSTACGLVRSSGVGLAAQAGPAPVVTAASSQYFERTFNRLVAAPPALEPVFPVAPPPPVIPVVRAPIVPVAPAPTFFPVAQPPAAVPVAQIPNVIRVTPNRLIPLQPPRPVFIQPTTKDNQSPTVPENSVQNAPSDPNIAIAVATANAAAPVATILLPPYPFGPPPSFGFIPSSPTFVPEDKLEKESTTQTPKTEATSTEKTNEFTTPVSSNSDNSFVQALPSNENVDFKQYLPPPGQLPLMPHSVQRPQTVAPQLPRPQKLKTSVEVVPVPLTYIAPPPLKKHHPLKLVKVTKHIHTFIPTGKIIIRPVTHRVLFLATIAMAAAKPSFAPAALVAAPAPLVAAPAPVVTASSSQYIARNYNGVVAAPLVAAPAPLVAAPSAYVAPAAKIVAPAAPIISAAAPIYARYASPYLAAPYYAPSAPLIAYK
ncbi:unnamed protein product, partial [Iphiclides podalirius]